MKNKAKIILIVLFLVGVLIMLFNFFCVIGHSDEVAGQAFTEWKCQLCGKSAVHGNTSPPKLCDECAKSTRRCPECGKLKIF